MIEMPNSHTLPNDQASTEMDFDTLTTTISNFVSNTQLFFNKSNDNTSYDDPNMKFNDGHKLSLVAYSILMVVSAIGNITVLSILLRRKQRNPSRLDIMLTHLAIADLLVTFLLMPLEIGWNLTVEWVAGDLMCRVMMFFRTFGLYLSSFILVCISVDRYYAVLKPLLVNENRGKIMISIAWVSSVICSAPQSYIFHVESHPQFPEYKQCVTFNILSNTQAGIYNIFCMMIMYALPLLIIIFCYGSIYYEIFQKSRIKNSDRFRRSSINILGRAKRRTLRMTITIVIVFVVCWTPYYISVVWFVMDPEAVKYADPVFTKSLYLFACTNSCANPIVYGIFNLKRKRTEKNTFSFNNTYCHESNLQRKRTISARAENFSRESSKTICINCADTYKFPLKIKEQETTLELIELTSCS